MELLMYISVGAGVLLYVTKLISFYAIMSPFPRFKKWLVAKPVRLAIIDLLFGIMGMHVISLAGGTMASMFIMIVFGACSIIYLCIMVCWSKIQEEHRHRKGVVYG
jgi:TM2 domain-containing membrane protein YozV